MAVKERKVSAIREGTVIDHIPPKATFKILQILDVGNELVTVGNNLSSRKMGVKGVVKVGGKELTPEEVNKIALLAPEAVVSVIRDFNVVDKFELKIPKELDNVCECYNPNCITRNQDVPTKFHVIEEKPLQIKCHYCEKINEDRNIVVL